MNPSTLARIHAFNNDVLRPAFRRIEQLLKTQTQHTVIVASDANTGFDEVDTWLQLMHPGKLYLTQTLNNATLENSSTSTPQQWIGESLYVEILQDLETEANGAGQYCLSIVFTITPTEEIQLTSIIGCAQSTRNSQIQTLPFGDELTPLPFEEIDSETIGLHFNEHFAAFEEQLHNPEIILAEEPIPENLEDLNPVQSNSLEPSEQPASNETSAHTPQKSEHSEFIDLLTLKQQVRTLSEKLSPHGFPINHQLNSNLATASEIKTLQNRYGQNTDLILEYSLSISAAELAEQLTRLGHYESLNDLAHQHSFVREKMQAWIKQNNQPSPGAIALHLNQSILDLRNALYKRITILLDHQLQGLSSTALKAELDNFKAQQQHQQAIFKQIDQNAVLGYLDFSLLDQDEIRQPHPLFTNPNESIQIAAQHLKNRDGKIILTLITSCDSEKYTRYLKRKNNSDEQNLFVGYSITQKLYPNRPIFIGEAPKAVFPRLECLWGYTDEPTMKPNPLTQIWCIYPMIRTDPAQWIVVAATTDQHPLKAIALENGAIAQEGTYEYLGRSLVLMGQSDDEYTHALAGLLGEALKQKRVKYLHIHQTWDPKTNEPRDIVQMQFQLVR